MPKMQGSRYIQYTIHLEKRNEIFLNLEIELCSELDHCSLYSPPSILGQDAKSCL